MVLSADDAAKFWPIYSDYDSELTKLNDKRVENIKEYGPTQRPTNWSRTHSPIKSNALNFWQRPTTGLSRRWAR